ncbi:hypothetical protein CBS101457_001326 [Exobasidium rhododendri]|nr:hypothetical protein CBS101457_001326 [Exobasidium rhododendri]
MGKLKRKKLAVSDDDNSVESGSDGERSSHRLVRAKSAKSTKGKLKVRRRDSTPSSEEVEEVLVDNSQAGLSRVKPATGRDKGKARDISEDEDESDSDNDDEDEERSGARSPTLSAGTLHGSDSEPGLGRWTTEDQEIWQDPDDNISGVYGVDIVIRWRWHQRRHFPQYRAKWEDYKDTANSWEPATNFDGDLVENFWKDIEFAGEGVRPDGWNKGPKAKDKELDEYDTATELVSPDAERRKAARKRKRRDIRIDRVEMRDAYRRKGKREAHERKEREEKLERVAEERRKKKRQEEEDKKKKIVTKNVITVGNKVRPTATGQAKIASSSAGSSSKPIANASENDVPLQDKPTMTDEQRRDFLRQYAIRPQQQIDNERKRARVGEAAASSSISAPAIKSTAAKSSAETGVQHLPGSTELLTITQAPTNDSADQATAEAPFETEVTAPLSLVNASQAKNIKNSKGDGKPKGSFKGAHRAVPKTKMLAPTWDPLNIGKSSKSASTSSTATTNRETASSEKHVESWDDEVLVVNGSTSTGVSSYAPVATPSTATTTSIRPLPPNVNPSAAFVRSQLLPTATRGAIQLGRDPRRPDAAPPLLSSTKSPMSPYEMGRGHQSPVAPMTNASPTYHANAASPLHPALQSPQEPGEIASTIVEQRANESLKSLTPADEYRAKQAIKAWGIGPELLERMRRSYNFVPPIPPLSSDQDRIKEKRQDLDRVIKYTGGGMTTTILAKHKEPQRRNLLLWIPNFIVPFGQLEREALEIPNFSFFCYGSSGTEEIWPSGSGKLIMYTFGALLPRLVEQCYGKKESCAWEGEERNSLIVVHPWQKNLLSQLIDANRVEELLRLLLASSQTNDLGDKDFAIVDAGMKVMEDFEEVPFELTYASAQDFEPPDITALDLEEAIALVDKEVSRTLHRLQYEWRLKRRIFSLTMAKTRLEVREVKTMYTIV